MFFKGCSNFSIFYLISLDVTYVSFGCKIAPPSKKSIKKPDTGHDKITLSYFQIIFLRKFVHELNIIDNHNLFLKG